MIKHFSDDENGGFFFTADDHEQLIARVRSFQDNSVPSGNSMAAMALLRLGRICGRTDWIEKAESTVAAAMPTLTRSPLASGQMLLTVERMLSQSFELVIAMPDENDDQQLTHNVLERMPTTASLVVLRDDQSEKRADYLEGKTTIGGQPTMYLCSEFKCSAPIIGDGAILDAVDQLQENLRAVISGE